MSTLSRREVLRLAGAAGAVAAGGALGADRLARAAEPPRPLPPPERSGIEHVVVVCMENRSFDHWLGWVPGADGRQHGLRYRDDAGQGHATHHLTDWQGCGFADPDHSYEGGRLQLAGGRCDGFRKGTNDDFALGYYTKQDLAFTSFLADHFTVCDRWFCSMLGPTYPNRIYTHAAATDRISNTSTLTTLPTIWDRLDERGIAANYYFSDLPVLALWGGKHAHRGRAINSFFTDVAADRLPAYSYLDPFFLGEEQGGSNDDHPHADIRRGQAFLSSVLRAVASSDAWRSTVVVITYDEWGGFFDHVRPPRLPDAFAPTATEEHNTAGFRVPTVIVSPFARRMVSHTTYDHTSILKLVEWRWGLSPLTPRDAAAANPAAALDFSAPHATPPAFPVVTDPGPRLCGPSDVHLTAADEETFWPELRSSTLTKAWM